MFKKFAAIALAVLMVMGTGMMTALAADTSTSCVSVGNDLTQEEIQEVYEYFGIERGTVSEITVTIDDEHATLDNTGAAGKIGNKSISCIYINVRDQGGLYVTTNNINWCTSEMYVNALTTAGIENADIRVTAPFAVSGTAALTGIYKAYEAMTGTELDAIAKQIGALELVTTAELADALGSIQSTELINQLKAALEETKKMSDSELRDYIREIASQNNVELTDDQVSQIFDLVRQLEGMNIDTAEWAGKLDGIKSSMSGLNNASDKVGTFFSKVGDFFTGIFDWIGNLFK